MISLRSPIFVPSGIVIFKIKLSQSDDRTSASTMILTTLVDLGMHIYSRHVIILSSIDFHSPLLGIGAVKPNLKLALDVVIVLQRTTAWSANRHIGGIQVCNNWEMTGSSI